MKTLVTINTDTKEIVYKGKTLSLPPKEFGIMETLAKTPGRCVSRTELLQAVWGVYADDIQDTRTVDQHVARLRSKTGRDIIQTVTVHGYRAPSAKIENLRSSFGKVSGIRREFGSKPYVTFQVTVAGDVVPQLTEGQRIKVA